MIMKNARKQNSFIEHLYKNDNYNLSTQRQKFDANILENLNEVFNLGVGQVGYRGIFLKLIRFFDNKFLQLAIKYNATEVIYPTIIPKEVLEKSDYFTSFPKIATKINRNHFLTPALCFHSYQQLENMILEKSPVVITTVGKCFRLENEAYKSLERLWDFTMREIICIGTYEDVEKLRSLLIQSLLEFSETLQLQGTFVKASDPFFTSDANKGKRILQKLKPLKFELRLSINKTETLAVSSFNHHESFFGECFNIKLSNSEIASTSCIAFGLERWVFAFLTQYGLNHKSYPQIIRNWLNTND